MDGEPPPAPKHLGVVRRQRRFDPEAKHGGRGGHTLVRARPAAHIASSVPGYSNLSLSVGEGGDPLALRWAAVARADLEAAAAELEAACCEKTVQRDRRCPDVWITKYKVTVEENADDGSVRTGSTVYSLSSIRSTEANVRRFPRGFDACHLGCSKCGKNRGLCRDAAQSAKNRRARFRRDIRKELGVSLGRVPEEGAAAVDGDLGPGPQAFAVDDDGSDADAGSSLPPGFASAGVSADSDGEASSAASSALSEGWFVCEDSSWTLVAAC